MAFDVLFVFVKEVIIKPRFIKLSVYPVYADGGSDGRAFFIYEKV